MLCHCNTSIDIRGRCLPNHNRKQWNSCKAKIVTTQWLIFNDYDIYKLIENYSFEDDRVKDAVKAKYFFTEKDWEGILELYADDSEMH